MQVEGEWLSVCAYSLVELTEVSLLVQQTASLSSSHRPVLLLPTFGLVLLLAIALRLGHLLRLFLGLLLLLSLGPLGLAKHVSKPELTDAVAK